MERTELINFRKKKKLTQKEMAEKLGINDTTYKFLELGYRNPSLKLMKKFKATFPSMNIEKIFLT